MPRPLGALTWDTCNISGQPKQLALHLNRLAVDLLERTPDIWVYPKASIRGGKASKAFLETPQFFSTTLG